GVAIEFVVAHFRPPYPIRKQTGLDMMRHGVSLDGVAARVGDVVPPPRAPGQPKRTRSALLFQRRLQPRAPRGPVSRRAQVAAHVAFRRVQQIPAHRRAPRMLHAPILMEEGVFEKTPGSNKISRRRLHQTSGSTSVSISKNCRSTSSFEAFISSIVPKKCALPWCRNSTRSASRCAKRMSCVTTMLV